MTSGHPVVSISKRDSPLAIGNVADAKCVVDGDIRSNGAQERLCALSVKRHILTIETQPHEPRTSTAELHRAHGKRCRIREVSIVEDVVQIERQGFGAHGRKSLLRNTVSLQRIETRNTNEIEITSAINIVEIEPKFGVVGGEIKFRSTAAKSVGDYSEGIADTQRLPSKIRS